MRILYLLFCSLFLVSGIVQGQTYRYKVVSSCHDNMSFTNMNSGNAAPVIYIAEGDNVTITLQSVGSTTQVCNFVNNSIRRNYLAFANGATPTNGVSVTLTSTGSSTYTKEAVIAITNANAVNHNGFYHFDISDVPCNNFRFNINVVPKPNWRISQVSDICLDSDTKVKISGPASGLYTWKVIPSSASITEPALVTASGQSKGTLTTPSASTFESTTSISRANILPTTTITDLSFVAEYKEASNSCIWRERLPIAVHMQKP